MIRTGARIGLEQTTSSRGHSAPSLHVRIASLRENVFGSFQRTFARPAGLFTLAILLGAEAAYIVKHHDAAPTAAPAAASHEAQGARALVAALPPPKPKKHLSFHPLSGIASWYGSVLQGHPTASGEIFNDKLMTACHNSLPFGTRVRVTDVSSKRSVVVRINDRGILSPGRVIDLSSAAAERLGILRMGIAKVQLEVLTATEGKRP